MATSTLQYDPDAPVYASPTNNYKKVSLGSTQDPSKVINANTATVAGQLKGLLASGSPLLKAAQSDSSRASNAKGLLNTSMAVEEGTNAAIKTATPIAQQDATTYSNMYAANNAAYNEGLMNNQVSELETNKLLKQGEITGALSNQEITSQYDLQKMGTEEKKALQSMSDDASMQRTNAEIKSQAELQKMSDDATMQRTKAEIDSQYKLQEMSTNEKVTLQTMADDATMQRTLTENESAKLIQSMESSQQNKEALMAVVSNMGQDMLSSINSIILDKGLNAEAKKSAIDSITANYKASVTTAASIANLDLSWSSPASGGTTTTTTPTTTTGAKKPISPSSSVVVPKAKS